MSGDRVIACMGGWCSRRDGCGNFLAADREHPVERLCGELEEPNPVEVQAWRHRREALRVKAQTVLDQHAAGKSCDNSSAYWAQQIVASIPPMQNAGGA